MLEISSDTQFLTITSVWQSVTCCIGLAAFLRMARVAAGHTGFSLWVKRHKLQGDEEAKRKLHGVLRAIEKLKQARPDLKNKNSLLIFMDEFYSVIFREQVTTAGFLQTPTQYVRLSLFCVFIILYSSTLHVQIK